MDNKQKFISGLTKGMLINVFQMPISDEKFEGVAKLHRKADIWPYDPETGETWLVKFKKLNGKFESAAYRRLVHPRNLIRG